VTQFLYVNNYGGPLRTDVFDSDGITPKLPLSANITVLNMDTGETVVSDEACAVESGSAYYTIPSGSPITSSSAHMLAYMDVLVESGNLLTNRIAFDVLDKSSYLILDTWRRKVSESAPSDDLTTDEAARDWIDDAVAEVSRRYGITTYTSTLGALSPTPTANDRQFYASVAALMARTAWWAGKGTWRDGEMSLNVSPFKDEWDRLDAVMQASANADMFAVYQTYNRDNVLEDSHKYDSPLWPYVLSGSTVPDTIIPL
jgi:hypothetical protein